MHRLKWEAALSLWTAGRQISPTWMRGRFKREWRTPMTSGIFVQKGIELSSRSRKILLIDEEAGDLKILRLTLEGQGFEVLTYTSYEAAFYAWRRSLLISWW